LEVGKNRILVGARRVSGFSELDASPGGRLAMCLQAPGQWKITLCGWEEKEGYGSLWG